MVGSYNHAPVTHGADAIHSMSCKNLRSAQLSVLLCIALAACGGTEVVDQADEDVGEQSATATEASGQTDIDTEAGEQTDPVITVEGESVAQEERVPNLLLIISDDQGIDASSQYFISQDLPVTPVIDELAASGIVFDNAWATPSCTTTRGTLITGQHGVNSGIDTVPNLMDPNTLTMQRYLGQDTNTTDYATGVIGKWHLAGASPVNDLLHPEESGVDYYAGTIAGTIDDYFNWTLTSDGQTSQSTTYHTSAMTDLAIDWMTAQEDNPWFLWLAYVSPHSPFHLPPAELHTRNLSGDADDIENNSRAYYLAAIEAMDTEIGRLLDAMPDDTRDNTLVVFLGDNGTPARVIDQSAFPRTHSKNTLYEGGIRVPMVVSGAGVTRQGQREDALVNSSDVFATFVDVAGLDLPQGLDSVSFSGLLQSSSATQREFNYSEFVDEEQTGWVSRNAFYKLIEYADGRQEMYDLQTDLREENNLLLDGSNLVNQQIALADFAEQVRSGSGSENSNPDDNEQTPGESDSVDITNATLQSDSTNCATYVNAYSSGVTDVGTGTFYNGDLQITVENDLCTFSTNAVPNHDFNDGINAFANEFAPQEDSYVVTSNPQIADATTALSLTVDNAILLNGVKVDLLAAACFNVGDGRVGCNDADTPWRYDPVFLANGFRVDSHNAHTQPDGTYHYHGKPEALYVDNNSEVSSVIGFAADGFPIFGSFIDDNGTVRSVRSSYQLITGSRPMGDGQPSGEYDGTFRDDYEYVSGSGDLDECNGRTLNGEYRYHVTDSFPHIMACFKGTPHESFIKR